MPELIVVPFRHGPLWNFSYLVACAETREAVVIDPAWDVARIRAAAEERGLTVKRVLLTHAHSDHSNGVSEFANAGVPTFIHAAEADDLARVHAVSPDTFDAPASLTIGTLSLKALPTPGHSPGSTSFFVGGHLFAGDALQVGSIGRPGSGPGALETHWRSLREVILALPGETVLHPGHDEGSRPTATLAEERQTVPGLRATTFEEFHRAVARDSGRHHGVSG